MAVFPGQLSLGGLSTAVVLNGCLLSLWKQDVTRLGFFLVSLLCTSLKVVVVEIIKLYLVQTGALFSGYRLYSTTSFEVILMRFGTAMQFVAAPVMGHQNAVELPSISKVTNLKTLQSTWMSSQNQKTSHCNDNGLQTLGH